MVTSQTPVIPTIQELRRRWEPHKERFDRAGSGQPTAVRFHRACSWLEEAERLEERDQRDHALIFRWTGFNALYGQWDVLNHEPLPDRQSWRDFLVRLLELDKSRHIINLLHDQKGLALAILGNGYLNNYFWHDPDCRKASRTGRGGRSRALAWYKQEDWERILIQLVDRIYLLRCQLVHGAATLGSGLNREAVKHCTAMMGLLMPTVLLVWIDHGASEDWGIMCYPPIDNQMGVRVRRPRK